MTQKLKNKLANLPARPGVYYFLNKKGQIIYVGKAVRLKARVSQYFQPATQKTADTKTKCLLAEIVDLDSTTVASELEAFFLENEMIRRYKPTYNIISLYGDNQNYYVRINAQSSHPTVTIERQIIDQATHYGPFWRGKELRAALKVLRRIFPYSTHKTLPRRGCLQFHLGLCPGPETDSFDLAHYRQNLKYLQAYLRGNTTKLQKELIAARQAASDNLRYELAGGIHKQILALEGLHQQIIFPPEINVESVGDHARNQLARLFNLGSLERLEAYDISHSGGQYTTGSLAVFENGLPARGQYRWFKLFLPGNDDCAHLAELLARRFKKRDKPWPQPQLILVDGGKGQVATVNKVLNEVNLRIPLLGLAKKEEKVIFETKYLKIDKTFLRKINGHLVGGGRFSTVSLPARSPGLKLLQRLRDESHRQAVTSQRTVKRQSQLTSQLTQIAGIGPTSHRQLMRHFGSLNKIKGASLEELAQIIGDHRAKLVVEAFAK